jgi:cell division transport system permease protein
MSEGLVQGLLGSGVAAGIVYLLHWSLETFSKPTSVVSQIALTGWRLAATEIIVVAVGLVIGTGGSALAVRRFLDV